MSDYDVRQIRAALRQVANVRAAVEKIPAEGATAARKVAAEVDELERCVRRVAQRMGVQQP